MEAQMDPQDRDRLIPLADSTMSLLERARVGDRDALNLLMGRYLPVLERWATGRLPAWARGVVDTGDLVQDTLIRSFKNIERFEARGEGALLAYLRQALRNRIADEVRSRMRRAAPSTIDTAHPDEGASPLELAVGSELLEQYEQALSRLRPVEREAIIARVELGYSYEELAAALNKPTAGAARLAVTRALARLARLMDRNG
jgi:RNA polymerase sigma factor (sigma-70 family)